MLRCFPATLNQYCGSLCEYVSEPGGSPDILVNRSKSGLHFPCYVLFPFCSSLRLRCDINLKRVGSQEVPTHMASGTDSDEQFFYQWVFYEASVQSSDGSNNRNRG